MNIDSLFSNPIIKNLAFKTLKKSMLENDVKGFLVTLDEHGEIQVEACKHEQVVISAGDLKTYQDAVLKTLE